MTENSHVWDGILVGDAATAPYSSLEWAAREKLMQGVGTTFPNYGIIPGTGDGSYPPLFVAAKSPASTNIEVKIGGALVNGRLYENTAALTLAVGANASGNPRIDTVILRVDYVAQTVRLVIKQGTPAGSPARPALTQNTTTYEIPLADVAVANGFATLAQNTISQRQRSVGTQFAGWQAKAFPLSYVVLGSTGQTIALTPAQTVLIPMLLNGNMNLAQIQFSLASGVTTVTYGWDLYIEDVNDGNASDGTIRRVAQSANDLTDTGNKVVTSLVMGGKTPLDPGLYWLAIQNRHASNNLTIDAVSTGILAIDRVYTKVTTNPNGQTLDAVTGWANSAFLPHACLIGYTFGTVLGS